VPGPRPLGRVPGRWRDIPEVGDWPFRQSVAATGPTGDALAAQIEAAFRESGYAFDPGRPLSKGATGYHPRGGPLLMAERDIRTAPLSRPKRVAAVVLLVSGLGLGGVESIVFGAPILAVPWILGSVGASAIFAFLLNRAYDSDIVLAVPLLGPRPAAAGASPGPGRTRSTVVFLGGQVRSEVFGRPTSGSRDVVSVSDEVHALRGMTEVAKAFERLNSGTPTLETAETSAPMRPSG